MLFKIRFLERTKEYESFTSKYTSLFSSLCLSFLLFTGCEVLEDQLEDEPEINASFTISPENPSIGQEVELDATSTTLENGTSAEYVWELQTPESSNAELSSVSGARTSFVPDTGGNFEIGLTVSAGGASDNTSEIVPVENQVEISSNISSERTLTSEAQYIVTSSIEITDRLTIEPGTQIAFEDGTRFEIRDGGVFIAEGTEDEPIIFTATEKVPGWWDGIFFRSSENPLNSIDHAIVEYAGGDNMRGTSEAAIIVARQFNDAAVSITNTTVRNSGNDGLYVRGNGELLDFESNTFINNDRYPVYLSAVHVHELDSTSQYSGNTTDYVRVFSADVSGSERTWQNLDVPYLFSATTEFSNVQVTISPGAHFVFRNEARLEFRSDGVIKAEGTEEEPILFTGEEQIPGWWDGLFFRSSSNPLNSIDYAIVEYAGGDSMRGTSDAGVIVGRQFSDAQLTMTNSVLRNNGGYGIYVRSDSEINDDVCEVNEFSENESGACGGSVSAD